jgi:hypothetical protein
MRDLDKFPESFKQAPTSLMSPVPAGLAGAIVQDDGEETPHNTRGWKEFAELINGAWRKGAEALLEAGRYLIEAKEELDRDEYNALIKLRLAFDASTAKKLVCIGSNRLLGAHVHLLAPCWSTLYELTKLGDEVLQAAIGGAWSGDIHLELLGRVCRAEVKARHEFRTLQQWLSGADLLLLKADRCDPIAVLPVRLFAELIAAGRVQP